MKDDYKKIIRENLNNTLDSGYIEELGEHLKGKVRHVHFPEGKEIGRPVVMVASDRVSVFDHVLDRKIPFKGIVLNKLNEWAMNNTTDIIKNASLPSPHPSVLIQKYCNNIMVECVVRGYVWGSMAGEYESGQRDFYGTHFEDGLLRYQKLEEPFFTPTTKAEHDEAMTYAEVEEKLGKDVAAKVKSISIELYKRASQLAKERGLLFIDTKYEFGFDENNELTLIDEANTPDSSRYSYIEEYEKFEKIKSEMEAGNYANVTELLTEKPELKIKELSKQFVRDIITEKGFSYGSSGDVPNLDDDDVVEVSNRYIKLYENLTGEKFEFPDENIGLMNSLKQKLKEGGIL
ncbi:MAG: phosphoribosylaminoimidazolesuccinocarboxamide synthase [Bacteroidota bacterium]